MMRKLLLALALVSLTGCSTIKDMIPSFSDNEQSRSIVTVRLLSERLNCDQPLVAQITPIRDELRWFELYSRGKGWRQNDVLKLVHPMQDTVEDFYKRAQDGQATKGYCEIKRKIMITQSSRAAEAVLGRF